MIAPLFEKRLVSQIDLIDWNVTYVWMTLLVLMVVMLTPLILFLRRGWKHRRSDILSSFNAEASAIYILTFQSEATNDVTADLHKLLKAARDTRDRCIQEKGKLNDNYLSIKFNLSAFQQADDQEGVRRAEAEEANCIAQIATAEASLNDAIGKYLDASTKAPKGISSYYDAQFGQGKFLGPALLLASVVGVVVLLPAAVALAELRGQPLEGAIGNWAWAVSMAILGGYTRVVFELISRYVQENLRPSDLLWCSFRILISIPLGYAVGKSLGGSDSHLALAVAYLLGLFPTGTIMSMGSKLFYKWVLKTEAQSPSSPLLILPCLDQQAVELLNDEGIANVTQLAYSDPVRTSIRTGLSFGFVVSCQSEALLGMYLADKGRMDIMRLFGVCGAYEAATLIAQLREGTDDEKQLVDKLIGQISDRLKLVPVQGLPQPAEGVMTKDGLVNVLEEVAGDPYTQLIRQTWANGVAIN